MQHQELIQLLDYTGKDPSRLIFEDELTGLYNRRFLFQYFHSKISWDNTENEPISLIMMDVDNFKEVNDTYGHQVGDQALVWVAELIRTVIGEEGLPIRYAGDELMILMQNCGKQTALKTANRVLHRVRSESFRPDGKDFNVRITLSMGIASAPEDAGTAKSLIHQADIALYFAKKIGRDCLVNAGEVVQEAVFAKTAINQLEEVQLVGRSQQLSIVTEALNRFSHQQNQFLLVEGAAGIGKSEFLETIRRNLVSMKIWRVKVSGDPQEMFSPYYLFTRILVNLLNQQRDKGAAAVGSLNSVERAYLGQVLPQLGGEREIPQVTDQQNYRKGIYSALAVLFLRSVGERPITLFVDDLHFADEASLLLIRQLMKSKDISIFVCGSVAAIHDSRDSHKKNPIKRFIADFANQIGIQKLTLTPLTPEDIGLHIKEIFPNARIPKGFTKELHRISQGNPLFLSELLRKLVIDHKVTLVGQQWIIDPLEEGYLPNSIEEIVIQKIAALDEESRQLLDQVSTIGEKVSLSMLVGSTEKLETRVLDFIDQAAAQGLISSQFNLNDDIIRFLGKRVLEITYGAIDKDRKKEIHESIGNYKEKLYKEHLLPSAATLAYHFTRSSNQEKAENYEEMESRAKQRKFSVAEAAAYTLEMPVDGNDSDTEFDVPLKPEDMKNIPNVIRDFMVAIRNIKLYPPGSKSIIKINQQLMDAINQVLDNNERLSFVHVKKSVLINGQKIDTTDFKLVADAFRQIFNRFELKGIVFQHGLKAQELESLLQVLAKSKQKTFPPNYWRKFSAKHKLDHIRLKQIRYAVKASQPAVASQSSPEAAEPSRRAQMPTNNYYDQTSPLDQKDVNAIAVILGRLLAAAKSTKLYPVESKSVQAALIKLLETLQEFFKRQRVLTISRSEDVLLINGESFYGFNANDPKGIAESFLKFLDKIELETLTFLENTNARQLEIFVAALGDLPVEGGKDRFWKKLADTAELPDIRFDQDLYEIRVAQGSAAMANRSVIADPSVSVLNDFSGSPMTGERFDFFVNELPDQINDWFFENKLSEVEQAVNQLFAGLEKNDNFTRKKVITASQTIMERLTLAYQNDFAKILIEPLLSEFTRETDPQIVVEMTSLLNDLITNLIQFVEYPLASRVLDHLYNRLQGKNDGEKSHAHLIAKSLERQLDPLAQELLVEDLKSGHPERQRNATQLLGSLGPAAIPLLINIIKREDNYRARQIAATLLEKIDPRAINTLKGLIVLEINVQERVQILEIIDTLTSDLKAELAHALGDENQKVRRAAYALAARLRDEQTMDWLLEFAGSDNLVLAESAVKCLGNRRSSDTAEKLISLLNSTKEARLAIACCRALGQIARPVSIEPLFQILASKKIFVFRKRHPHAVRAAAAFALGQIRHPDAAARLADFANDSDPRVREIALNAVANAETPGSSTTRKKSALPAGNSKIAAAKAS